MPRSFTLGLISDTHIPFRWNALPDSLPHLFDGVDLILHAGDVGELRVLDELSGIAPVVAVHGNDEPAAETTTTLPFKQVLSIAGQRVLLSHSHLPNRADELASRKTDDWGPKLARRAAFAREQGASIYVFGHTHIPMSVEVDGVWLINPGAIAPGNYLLRQRIQSVARLTLSPRAAPVLRYLNLAKPDTPWAPGVDVDAGYRAALFTYCEQIVSDELMSLNGELSDDLYALAPQPLMTAFRQAAEPCWHNGQARYGIPELVTQLRQQPDVPDTFWARLAEIPAFQPHL